MCIVGTVDCPALDDATASPTRVDIFVSLSTLPLVHNFSVAVGFIIKAVKAVLSATIMNVLGKMDRSTVSTNPSTRKPRMLFDAFLLIRRSVLVVLVFGRTWWVGGCTRRGGYKRWATRQRTPARPWLIHTREGLCQVCPSRI